MKQSVLPILNLGLTLREPLKLSAVRRFLLELLIRLATIPLFIIMGAAFVTTKIPILLGKSFWAMAHDGRTDFAMTLLLVFLLIYRAGKCSAD